MNYEEAIAYIHQTPKFSRVLGNTLLKKLLDTIDRPQDKLQFIHIAGTNGKGSVACMLAEILQAAGLRVGLFTSPYIERFNERIKVDQEPIADENLAEIITMLKEKIETHDAPVSEFALDTAAAFCYFVAKRCDMVVLETGLGGRLDATNVISQKRVAVLTSIGMDHMQYLGDTIEKITEEKCGIMANDTPVVCAPRQDEAAMRTILAYAESHHAPLYAAKIPQKTPCGAEYQGERYELGLKGDFQADNAATVLETVRVLRKQGLHLSDEAVRYGLAHTKHVARFEWLGDDVVLDGGHNLPAAQALRASLEALHRPIFFCVAMMEDKDFKGYIEALAPIAQGAVLTQISMPRCASAESLAFVFAQKGIETLCVKDPCAAVKRAKRCAQKRGAVLCVCGSLYFAGEVRRVLAEDKC